MNKMDIQAFFEKFIIRDILAILMPGALILLGLSFFSIHFNSTTDGIGSAVTEIQGWASVAFLLFFSFILGHLVDLIYRKFLQTSKLYTCVDEVEKLVKDPHIEAALNEFWNERENQQNNNNNSEPEGRQKTFILRYWIELRNKELYDSEIEHIAIKAHYLVASGISLTIFGLCCLAFIKINMYQSVILAVLFAAFGISIIYQGFHQRKVLIQHIYRVFYVLWRQRSSEKNKGDVHA